MPDQIKILIQYNKTVDSRTFSDTIVLSQDEYASMSEEDLENIKQSRFDAWLAVIDASNASAEA
jgi:hypothetical protein